MEYALGVITGILLSAFLVLIDILMRRKVEPKGIIEYARRQVDKPGEIIEAEDTEDFIKSITNNGDTDH